MDRLPGLAHADRRRAEKRGRHHGHLLHDDGLDVVHAQFEIIGNLLPVEPAVRQGLLGAEPERAVDRLATDDTRGAVGRGHGEVRSLPEHLPEQTSQQRHHLGLSRPALSVQQQSHLLHRLWAFSFIDLSFVIHDGLHLAHDQGDHGLLLLIENHFASLFLRPSRPLVKQILRDVARPRRPPLVAGNRWRRRPTGHEHGRRRLRDAATPVAISTRVLDPLFPVPELLLLLCFGLLELVSVVDLETAEAGLPCNTRAGRLRPV
eukprot:5377703-Pyramimonas_sp.AAC.1